MRGRPSRRPAQVLAYVKETLRLTGRAPSYGMICDATGIRTRREVNRVVHRLEEQGHLKRWGSGRVRRINLI